MYYLTQSFTQDLIVKSERSTVGEEWIILRNEISKVVDKKLKEEETNLLERNELYKILKMSMMHTGSTKMFIVRLCTNENRIKSIN